MSRIALEWRAASNVRRSGGMRQVWASSPASPAAPARYAVVGGGFAGVATAWHIISNSSRLDMPVQLHLYDAYGLGAGGSGAAAGLLHPYTPRGKLLWQGLEGFQEALQLVEVAETAAAAAASRDGCTHVPLAWRNGILRPAQTAKQACDLAKFALEDPAAAEAAGSVLVNAEQMATLVPGLQTERLLHSLAGKAVEQQQTGGARGRRAKPAQQGEPPSAAGLLAARAVVVSPRRYLDALWAACQQQAACLGCGSAAELRLQPVTSLEALEAEQGRYDGVVVAAGAAVDSIAETAGRLPLDLCQGYTLHLQPRNGVESSSTTISTTSTSSSSSHLLFESSSSGRDDWGSGSCGYPPGAPSLLGPTYISAQGGCDVVVGATQRHGLPAAEAYALCGHAQVADAAEAQMAVEALLPPAAELWPPVAGWSVGAVLSGVRALPSRGSDGSVPYAGRLPSPGAEVLGTGASQEPGRTGQPNWWVVGGLGARGLVYHAWLGRLVAEAMLTGTEACLPQQLLRWKQGNHP